MLGENGQAPRLEYGARFTGLHGKAQFVAFLKDEDFRMQLKMKFLEMQDIDKALDAVRMMVVKAVSRRS